MVYVYSFRKSNLIFPNRLTHKFLWGIRPLRRMTYANSVMSKFNHRKFSMSNQLLMQLIKCADRRETCIEKLMSKTTGMLWWKSTISIRDRKQKNFCGQTGRNYEFYWLIFILNGRINNIRKTQSTQSETLASVAEKQNSMLVDIETWDTIMSWTK